MKKQTLVRILWILVLVILVVKAIIFVRIYPDLPPRIAIHFDLHGVANGFASRFWGLWGMYLIDVLVALAMWGTTKLPASMITGMEDVPEEHRPEALANMSLLLVIIELLCTLLMAWADYYVVMHN